jgi:hypothetical protein
MTPLTVERLKELLSYDPESGEFHWLVDRGKNANKGKRAGTVNSKGYRVIQIDGKTLREHRLAWLYVTGSWPEHEVDHRDLDKLNNRFDNLRPATRSQNTSNKIVQANSLTGVRGVNRRENGKYRAYIAVKGKRINLGTFDTLPLAHMAYIKAAVEHHGEFARATMENPDLYRRLQTARGNGAGMTIQPHEVPTVFEWFLKAEKVRKDAERFPSKPQAEIGEAT